MWAPIAAAVRCLSLLLPVLPPRATPEKNRAVSAPTSTVFSHSPFCVCIPLARGRTSTRVLFEGQVPARADMLRRSAVACFLWFISLGALERCAIAYCSDDDQGPCYIPIRGGHQVGNTHGRGIRFINQEVNRVPPEQTYAYVK